MYHVNAFWNFIGRLGISAIFIIGGVFQAMAFKLANLAMKKILCFWHEHVTMGWAQSIFSFLDSISYVLVGLAIVLQLVGGVLVLFGIKVRFGAFLLFLFLVPATLIVHQFWLEGTPNASMEFMRFFLNIALMGTMVHLMSIRKDYSGS